jgi:hypothetical protein
MMEKWNNGIKVKGLFFRHSNILPSFQYSTIPFSIARLLFCQGHDDVGVPGAIEV